MPVFAQESVNSTMSNVTNTENATISNIINTIQDTPETTKSTSWNVGIFAIIGSAITFIGILLTIRFVYIDKIHEKRIRGIRDDTEKALESQEKLFDTGNFSKENVRWFAEYISSFYVALEDVRQRRKGNSHNGIFVDVICMGILFIIGSIATTGFFKDIFIILLVIIGVTAFFPVIHFVIQLKRIKYEIQFNHS
jgi:hypothetical protein